MNFMFICVNIFKPFDGTFRQLKLFGYIIKVIMQLYTVAGIKR